MLKGSSLIVDKGLQVKVAPPLLPSKGHTGLVSLLLMSLLTWHSGKKSRPLSVNRKLCWVVHDVALIDGNR